MDPDLMRAAQAELQPGERLQWAGRPSAAALARSQLWGSLVGVPVVAFAVFWTAMAFRDVSAADTPFGIGHFFWLFGCVFIAVGLWQVLAAPRAMLRARLFVYGVTDRRVFIVARGRTRSWRPADLGQLNRRDRADGFGDIEFRSDADRVTRAQTAPLDRGLYGVARVREVEALIMKLREQH
jgi:hypothetical protein